MSLLSGLLRQEMKGKCFLSRKESEADSEATKAKAKGLAENNYIDTFILALLAEMSAMECRLHKFDNWIKDHGYGKHLQLDPGLRREEKRNPIPENSPTPTSKTEMPRKEESVEYKRLRRIFDKYDDDNSGEWELEEMEAFLEDQINKDALGYAKNIFFKVDKDRSGLVDFEEFYDWYMRFSLLSVFHACRPQVTSHSSILNSNPRFLGRYMEIVQKTKTSRPTRRQLARIFDKFDKDHSCSWEIKEMEV